MIFEVKISSKSLSSLNLKFYSLKNLANFNTDFHMLVLLECMDGQKWYES